MAEYLNRLDNKYFTNKNKSISIIDSNELFAELEIMANMINSDLTITIDNATKQIVQGKKIPHTFLGINENLQLDFITIDKCISNNSILSTIFEDRNYANSFLLTSTEVQNRITPIQSIKFPNNNNTILMNNNGNLVFSKINSTLIADKQIVPDILIPYDTLDSTILQDDVINKNLVFYSIDNDCIQNYSINFDEKVRISQYFSYLLEYFTEKFDIADEQLPKFNGNTYPQDSKRKAYLLNSQYHDIIADKTITPEKFADNSITWRAFTPYNEQIFSFDIKHQFIHGDSLDIVTNVNMLYDMKNRNEENYNKVLDLLDEDFIIEHDDLPKIYDANTIYSDPLIKDYKGLRPGFFSRSLATAIQLWLNDNNLNN